MNNTRNHNNPPISTSTTLGYPRRFNRLAGNLFACLAVAVIFPIAPRCLGQEKSTDASVLGLEQLPETALDRKGEFNAKFQKLPDTTGVTGQARIGFAFRTPRLVDDPVTWLVLWNEEKPNPATWQVTSADGSELAVAQPLLDELKRYPELTKRYPTAKSVQRLRISQKHLIKDRRYQAVLTLPGDARSPLGISVNAASDGIGGRAGGVAREIVIPKGWIPTPLVMELMEDIRAQHGDAAAIDFLQDQFAKKADRPSEFGLLHSKVWNEAQFGTGRSDTAWGSRLNDAAFLSSYKAGYYAEAFSIMNNLCARLAGSGRFGRLAEVHAFLEEAYRSAGMRLDISTYPDLGPAIPSLPSVRHRKIQIAVPFSKQFPKGQPVITRVSKFGTKEAGTLRSYGWNKFLCGAWREGLEWNVWIRDWSTDDKGILIQSRNGLWYDATLNISEILGNRGFDEEALAMINEAAAAPYGRNYRRRAKIIVELRQIDLMRRVGRPDPDMIPKLRELVVQIENHLHFGKNTHWHAEIVLTRALFDTGQQLEGERLLEEIIKEGSISARHARLDHWINIGRTEGVEDELISLLLLERNNGHKIDELDLYARYADFLEKTGRLEEALIMRREAIRLCRDFDVTTHLPVQLAKLASLLQELGDRKGSEDAANEALTALRLGEIPESNVAEAREILEKLKPVAQVKAPENDQLPEVDIQPQLSMVIPIERTEWTTYLAIANTSTRRESGHLRFTGAAAKMSVEESTNDVSIQLGDGAVGDDQTIDLALDPASYRLIAISAGASFRERRELKLNWGAEDGHSTTESTVWIEEPEAEVTSSIIQAGKYQANPFYGVTIYLSYLAKNQDAASLPIRFVASQVARVELYQLDGTPLAIDGQGNGSLLNGGDELFGTSDGAGNLVLPLKKGRCFLQIRVYPKDPIAEDGLQLDAEVFNGEDWILHSRNRVTP